MNSIHKDSEYCIPFLHIVEPPDVINYFDVAALFGFAECKSFCKEMPFSQSKIIRHHAFVHTINSKSKIFN